VVTAAPVDRPQCSAVAGTTRIDFLWQENIYEPELQRLLEEPYDVVVAKCAVADG
jgi:hypothetical protein